MTSAGQPVAPVKLRVAQVLRSHGVRGEVRVEPCGGDWTRFKPGTRVEVEDGSRVLTVRTSRQGPGNAVLLGFDEIASPADADRLRTLYLCVGVDAARPLDDGEWFVWQLVGLRVIDTDGTAVGVVEDVEAGVGNDVLVIKTDTDVRRLPMARDYVTGIDVAGGTLTVTPWQEESV
ncbi:MAG TPA: ribosome maturation factor RimM [Candidatus Acidoferrales bacterium]|nr:ribosome maturation factor RimM [Candidatus Acidoferrales bacterium]